MSYFRRPTQGAFDPPAAPPAPSPAPASEPEGRKRRSGLGAAGLLLGVIALLISWIPLVGLLAVLPALLAVLLGVVGVGTATVSGRTKRGLPIMSALVGVGALLLTGVSTLIGAAVALPYGGSVAADQAQVEIEHALARNGTSDDEAARIGEEIGDTLRDFARPENWRDGISFMHRFGLLQEDFERDLRRTGTMEFDRRAEIVSGFEADLATLARRAGMELSRDDVRAVVEAMQKRQEETRRGHFRHVESFGEVRVITNDGGCERFSLRGY